MTLAFNDGSSFSCGACRYFLKPAAPGDTYLRPFIDITVAGRSVEASFDTGGFFLILNSQIAELLSLRHDDGESETLQIRGVLAKGHLHRVTMTLEADWGESRDFDITAFVPDNLLNIPNLLGWTGCLERLRFAFDPNASESADGWFHFGPLDDDYA